MMSHSFGLENAQLEPEEISDVQQLLEQQIPSVEFRQKFTYKGVLVLRIIARKKPKHSTKKGPSEERVERRILILGHVADDPYKMVSLEFKGNAIYPCHGFDFAHKKSGKYPDVMWCRGLAFKHDGNTTNRNEVIKFRNEKVTQLLKLFGDEHTPWDDLDFESVKSMIDNFDRYLDPTQAKRPHRRTISSVTQSSVQSPASTPLRRLVVKDEKNQDVHDIQELPDFDIENVPLSDASDREEILRIFNIIDDFADLANITEEDTEKFAELMSKAYPVPFGRGIVDKWKEIVNTTSDYDIFTESVLFKDWWLNVNSIVPKTETGPGTSEAVDVDSSTEQFWTPELENSQHNQYVEYNELTDKSKTEGHMALGSGESGFDFSSRFGSSHNRYSSRETTPTPLPKRWVLDNLNEHYNNASTSQSLGDELKSHDSNNDDSILNMHRKRRDLQDGHLTTTVSNSFDHLRDDDTHATQNAFEDAPDTQESNRASNKRKYGVAFRNGQARKAPSRQVQIARQVEIMRNLRHQMLLNLMIYMLEGGKLEE